MGAGAALLALALAAAPAPAQEFPAIGFPLAVDAGASLLVIDQDRLFAESRFGQRVSQEIEQRSRALAAENRRFEAALEQEERDLTALRPTLDAAEFRDRADEFNRRVEQIRLDQDAKARGLASFRETEQQRFLAALGPVLAQIAAERGALAVLDRRLVLVAADSIDITREAAGRVDALEGDGAQPPEAPAVTGD